MRYVYVLVLTLAAPAMVSDSQNCIRFVLPGCANRTNRFPFNSNKITYWDAYDGTAIRVIEGGDEEMNTLDVEPSGEAFVSGGDDGLVKVRRKIQPL